jgi:hypothetical protein
MSDYYRNAYITVAAACSDNASGGLFQKRDASWIRPCRLGAKKFRCGCELWEEEVAPISPLSRSSEDSNIESTSHGPQVEVSPSSGTLEERNILEATLNSVEAADRELSGVNSSAAEEFVDPSKLPHKFSPDTRKSTTLIEVRIHDQDNCYYVFPPFNQNDGGDMYRPGGPLDRRAWTLQERMLSTRILSYGTDEIHWECCEAEASERIPEGLQDRRQEEQDAWKEDCYEYVVPMKLSLANSPEEYSTSEIDESNFWLSSWHRLVEDYSERRLTYDGDRLVAFFGLMTQMGISLDSEVIAGLREPVLWYDLLWSALKRSDEHGEGEQRRASSIAPSWSWASAGRSIAYRDTKGPYQRLERMMNSWSIEISKDEVDSVEATLIVNSEVKVAWATASNGWLFCATPKDGLVPTFSEDSFRCGYAVSQVEGSIVSQGGSLLEDRKWLAHWHPDDDSYRSMPLRFIWCIALARYHHYPGVSILCLVLEPLMVDGGVVKDFRRVGLASLNEAGWEKDGLLFDFGEKLLKVK